MTRRRLLLSSLLLLLLIPSLCAFCAAQVPSQAAAQHLIVVRAARLLDIKSGRLVKPGEVLVQGERIVEVGSSVKHPAGAEVIDLGDRVLVLPHDFARRQGSSHEVEIKTAVVFTFTDGKISRWEVYMNRDDGLKALGLQG